MFQCSWTPCTKLWNSIAANIDRWSRHIYTFPMFQDNQRNKGNQWRHMSRTVKPYMTKMILNFRLKTILQMWNKKLCFKFHFQDHNFLDNGLRSFSWKKQWYTSLSSCRMWRRCLVLFLHKPLHVEKNNVIMPHVLSLTCNVCISPLILKLDITIFMIDNC